MATINITPGWQRSIDLRLAALNLSIAALSSYSDISQSRLAMFLNGTRRLDNDAIRRIDHTLIALERLVDIVPFPMDLRRVDEVCKYLDMVRTGELGRVELRPTETSAA